MSGGATADGEAEERPSDPRLVNRTTGRILAARVWWAESLWARFVGAMGPRGIPAGIALALTPCDWVHTFLVAAPLDVVYCDRAGLVLLVVPDLKPWRFGPRVPGARIAW